MHNSVVFLVRTHRAPRFDYQGHDSGNARFGGEAAVRRAVQRDLNESTVRPFEITDVTIVHLDLAVVYVKFQFQIVAKRSGLGIAEPADVEREAKLFLQELPSIFNPKCHHYAVVDFFVSSENAHSPVDEDFMGMLRAWEKQATPEETHTN